MLQFKGLNALVLTIVPATNDVCLYAWNSYRNYSIVVHIAIFSDNNQHGDYIVKCSRCVQ